MLLGSVQWAHAAEFSLGALEGNWGGTGVYTDGQSTARVRCRLTGIGDNTHIRISGRCSSTLGREDIDMILVRNPTGVITLLSDVATFRNNSEVSSLEGAPIGGQLLARGSVGNEEVILILRFEDNGGLTFDTQRRWSAGVERSVIDLTLQ